MVKVACKHNLNHNYNLIGFDTIEIHLVVVVVFIVAAVVVDVTVVVFQQKKTF